MRAIAPHWGAQKANWGAAACLFERLALPASWLCQLAALEGEDARSLPEPVIQLLASSVATVLKAARVTGVNADSLLPYRLSVIPALRGQSFPGVQPAVTSLLLPKLAAGGLQGASSTLVCAATAMDAALVLSQCTDPGRCPLMVLGSCHMASLVDRTEAELLHCSTPAATRLDTHFSIGRMSYYAAYFAMLIQNSIRQGSEGAPFGPAQQLLARPLLRLLHSPLLDTLVALQHVLTRTLPSLQQHWESTAGAFICLSRLPQASGGRDAMDSKVALQVGHGNICYSI